MIYHNTPVKFFHLAFGHPVQMRPSVPSMEQRLLRIKLIAEELTELAAASGVNLRIDLKYQAEDGKPAGYEISAWPTRDGACDLVECADALGDLRYVIDGGNLIFGFPGEAILNEIHRSNMSKLGADGKPIYREDGKTLKGPNYEPPQIERVIREVVSGMYDQGREAA